MLDNKEIIKTKPLIIIAGPTATGKTEVSIKLAKAINGQIISADSMQAYKYMDIGSAKITPAEMEGIRHYGVDIIEPTKDYNVFEFQKMAKEAIDNIYLEGSIPIIVGGTGFYIQSVLYDIDFTDTDSDDSIRKELSDIAAKNGADYLHHMLEEIDKESALTIHANNVKRVIRAIEYYRKTGEKFSLHNDTQKLKKSPYKYLFFCLTDNRDTMYERIDLRVDKMLDMGLIDEVKKLKSMGLTRDTVSMQGLGYKEILDYINGSLSLDEAIYTVKRDTRHFAKRQLTWFRRESDVIWLNRSELGDTNNIFNTMLDKFNEYYK